MSMLVFIEEDGWKKVIKEIRINIEILDEGEQVGLLKAIFNYVSDDKLVHYSKLITLELVKGEKSE